MEEIRGTEALEQEILDDARKRAERIVRKAQEDAKSMRSGADKEIEQSLEALRQAYRQRQEKAEQEARSRIPLEKIRLEIQFKDAKLREVTETAVSTLPSALFARWCIAKLERQEELVRSSSARVMVDGLDEDSLRRIKALLGDRSASSLVEDASMKVRGVIVEPSDRSFRISITEHELLDWLLDEKRGELATALFGGA